jgi:hypothetical protein
MSGILIGLMGFSATLELNNDHRDSRVKLLKAIAS